MNTHILSTDTQTILLLCAQFGNDTTTIRALTLTEFNKFEQWLAEEKLNLSDLIETDSALIIEKLRNSGFDAERFGSLLSRGSALAIAVEQWTQTGLWILGRNDETYPLYLKERLLTKAPVVLYGAGNQSLLSRGGLAVVGSRDADEEALSFSHNVGDVCAQQEIQIISGGARGVDRAAMLGALERGGSAVGILSGNLAQEIVSEKSRMWLSDDKLVLLSPASPRAPFNIWSAMERNKLIYAMADYALVVSAELDKGGTWQGALENVKHGWTPLFVRDDENAPKGNRGLIGRGGIAIEPSAIHPDAPLQDTLKNLAVKCDTTRISKLGNKQQSILWSQEDSNERIRDETKKISECAVSPSCSSEKRSKPSKLQPPLVNHVNFSLKKLRKSIPIDDEERVYTYVIKTVQVKDDYISQNGSGPNWDGGLITLCTCKGKMRSYKSAVQWRGLWIAGFTGKNKTSRGNALVFLIRVGHAFESYWELWEYLPDEVRQAKTVHKNILGDVFKPKIDLHLDVAGRFDPINYKAPVHHHPHFKTDPDNQSKPRWHRDIDYTDPKTKRRASYLVGDETQSYLWTSTKIFLRDVKLTQGSKKWQNVNDLLDELTE